MKVTIETYLEKNERIYLQGSIDGKIKLQTNDITITGLTTKRLKDLAFEVKEALKRIEK